MGRVSYLRLPHLKDDLLCFVAEDDLWLAPLDGPGRAWRLTVDRTKLGHPRFSPDGSHIAYTSWRSLDPEVHLVPVDGGPGRRLTYWGSSDTRVCGWAPPDEDGRADLGRWQGIYLFEHRARPHQRRLTLHLIGD